MRAPFADWTYEDAAAAVAARLPKNYAQLKAYCELNDHWQEGDEWVGPGVVGSTAISTEKAKGIERQQAPYDAIGKALRNLANAYALEAEVNTAPLDEVEDAKNIPPEIAAKIKEADNLLTLLFDRYRIHKHHRPCIRVSAYAGRSGLRWWLPLGFALRSVIVQEDGTEVVGDPFLPTAPDFETAAQWLALSRPLPESAAVVTDELTQKQASVFLYTTKEGDRDIEQAEIGYVNEGGQTVIRTVYKDKRTPPEPMVLNLGGRLLYTEMEADIITTDPVIRGQRQANLGKTMITRSLETCGFPERRTGNMQPLGERREYKEGETIPPGAFTEVDRSGTRWVVIPEVITLGSDTTMHQVGLVEESENGMRYATPLYDRFDPVPPDHAIKAKDEAVADVLEMCGQGHLVTNSTGEASGFAYEQHRAEFKTDAEARKNEAESLLRDQLTTALALVEHLTNKVGYFTDAIRVVVTIHVNVGPASPQARTEDREAVKAGLMAPETAMARAGIEDLKNELERVKKHPFYQLMLLERVAEVYSKLAQFGSADAAARALDAVGIDPDIVAALRMRDTDGALEL